MQDYELTKMGCIRNADGELVPIYGWRDANGMFTLYFDNDPYGISEITNLPMEDFVDMEDKALYESMVEVLDSGARGIHSGILMTDDHFFFIDDCDLFTLIKERRELVCDDIEVITDAFVTEFEIPKEDEEDEEYGIAMELLNLMNRV